MRWMPVRVRGFLPFLLALARQEQGQEHKEEDRNPLEKKKEARQVAKAGPPSQDGVLEVVQLVT